MKKTSRSTATRSFPRDRRAWVLCFLLIAACYGSWKYFYHRRVVEPLDPARCTEENPRLAVLVYERVSPEKDGVHVDRELFRSHLEALERQGFSPVTPAEVLEFYGGGGRLPPRPLLLTFDLGYLETYTAVHPILAEKGWRAVQFIATTVPESRDTHYLYWDRLQRMVDSGVWEIGSHGHRGKAALEEAAGKGGEARLLADYGESRRIIESRLAGHACVAYAFPGGDPAAQARDAEAPRIHQEAVRQVFGLGFCNDGLGVNDRLSDPHRLKRLRVSPRWTADELLGRLRSALALPGAPAWVAGEGEAHPDGERITLRGSPRCRIWLPGARWLDDWALEVAFEGRSGEFWVVQETPDPAEEWRFGGSAESLYLQHLSRGKPPDTLRRFDWNGGSELPRVLKLIRRGRGIWAELDGRPLAELPIYLPLQGRGALSLIVWNPEGEARIELSGLRLEAYPWISRPLPPFAGVEPVQELIRDAARIAAISPSWLSVEGGLLKRQADDPDLARVLSRRHGWEIVPTVSFPGWSGPQPAAAWVDEAAALVFRENWDGLHLDLSALPPGELANFSGAIVWLKRELLWKGRRFLVTYRKDADSGTAIRWFTPIDELPLSRL